MDAEVLAMDGASSGVWARFRAMEAEMQATWLEREEPIRGLLCGLLSGQHVVLLGPPGTGKSALATDLCGRIGGQYFGWLLTAFSTPEELFGPYSLKALEQDRYSRITTGKLPQAHLGFLDEIFKANSAVLNALLAILNEGVFHNDGGAAPVPLLMAVGASNELPEDREALGALWDRFALRYVVDYVRDEGAFQALLTGAGAPASRTTVTLADVERARAEVAQVRLNGAMGGLIRLRAAMRDAQIPASDRRWKALLRVIQAHTWLEARSEATEDDLAVLVHALWQEPSQSVQVRQLVLAIANPALERATDLLEQAREVHAGAMAAQAKAQKDSSVDSSAAALEATKKLRNLQRSLEQLEAECAARHRDASRVAQATQEVRAMNEEVLTKCLGLGR
jgi:MoxR-like ATPase